MEYIVHILFLVAIYTILAVSLDLLAGHTGLLSIAHASFYGLGAYTSALLAVHLKAPFLLSLLASMAIGVMFSFLISLPSLRLHDDYFVIATFGFQMIIFSIFNNWTEVTRGPLGIPGIPPPSIFSWTINSRIGLVILAAILALFSYAVVHRITNSPFGRLLRAIREDEIFTQSLGKNTLSVKVTAFAISAALAAAAGSLYAYYITIVAPSSFTFMESVLIISMVIVGGAGSSWGPLIGAAILVSIPELLRSTHVPDRISIIEPNLRQIFYGVLLIVMMIVRPKGLVGHYSFGQRK